jgi:ATP-binding cassette subfamily B protein
VVAATLVLYASTFLWMTSAFAKAEHELFARIGELFADRSVLPISHRFSTVRSADRIYVLNEGYVVEPETHEELLAAGHLR